MRNKTKAFVSILFLATGISEAQEKPNFIVIITDDQTYESINALNNSDIRTPNLDRLVRTGTTFTNAFNQGSWSSAVSVASRSMLITGQYVNNACRNDSYLDDWAMIEHNDSNTNVPLWGEVFKKAGYTTFITGKWHNSDEALLKCFEYGKSIGEGFYESVSEEGKHLQYNRKDCSVWNPIDVKLGGHWNPMVKDIIISNGKRCVSNKYNTQRHTSETYGEAAIEFLRNYDEKSPFLMYVAFNAPHDPRQSPKRFVEYYDKESIKMPLNFMSEHPFNQGDSKIRDERLAPFPRTPEAIRLHRQEYYAIISHTDEVIGRIIDELEYRGLDKNTYIIFSSDHGLAIGSHGLMGKQNLYEHTIRMPFIIKGPGISKNVQTDELIYMQSIYPTTCELAGIDIPETVDYKSIVPIINDPYNCKGEKYIWGTYRNLQRMIRDKNYKLILYPEVKEIQLFDIQNDPYETINLKTNEKYSKILKSMFKLMKSQQIKFGDTLNLGNLEDYI